MERLMDAISVYICSGKDGMHLCGAALPIAAEIQAILKVGTPRALYCFLK
jgi:hypothetical protein